MKAIHILSAVWLGAGTAQAAEPLRSCTPADVANGQVDADDRLENHRQFAIRPIDYGKTDLNRFGYSVSLLVGADGIPVCIASTGTGYHASAANRPMAYTFMGKANPDTTPQRQAYAAVMAGWRYLPFVNNGKPVSVVVDEYVPEQIPPARHRVMPQGTLFSSSVRIEHWGCFGACPAYSVTLHGDGRVDYQGTAFVDATGQHTYRIPPGAVAALIERLRGRDLWSMNGLYAAPITDNATTVISLTIGGQTRNIQDYVGSLVGMPQNVSVSEDDIDAVADAGSLVNLTVDGIGRLRDEGFDFHSRAAADLLLRTAASMRPHDEAVLTALIDAGAPTTGGQLNDGVGYRFDGDGAISLLHAAVAGGYANLADRLIAGGALDKDGKPDPALVDDAFQTAVATGSLHEVRALWPYRPSLTYVERDCCDDDAATKTEPVTLLLEKPYGSADWDGFAIAQFLLEQGCDIKAARLDGVTLLRQVAGDGSPEFVQYLIDRGADINAKEDGGDTPIQFTDTSEDNMLVLMNAGADVTVKTDLGSVFETVAAKHFARARAWLVAHGYEAQVQAAETDLAKTSG